MWSMICLAVLALILILLIANWVRLGNLLRAVVASYVFGRENLQWTDVDWVDWTWSCHLWCAVCWKVFLVWQRLCGMIVFGSGLVVPALAATSASSLPGMPMWLGIQLMMKFLLLSFMSVWMSLFSAMLSRCGLRMISMAPWLSVWMTMFVADCVLASRTASRETSPEGLALILPEAVAQCQVLVWC